jgi:hypothetical protein
MSASRFLTNKTLSGFSPEISSSLERCGRALPHVSRIVAKIGLLSWILAAYWIAAVSVPLPNLACPQDLGLMLDAGWRHYQGLRPHADYHTPLGPLFAITFGLPMLILGPSYSSLWLLPPTLSTISALWTWLICRGVLSPWTAVLTSMGIGAITGGIYHMGFPPEALTFATTYNRISFGLFGIVALASLMPRPNAEPIGNRLRDCSVAVGTLMMLFCKANFAVAAAPFGIFSLIVYRRTRRDWIVVASVSIAVLICFLYQIGFRIDRMLADLMLVAQVRKEGVSLLFFPLRNTLANHDFLMLLALHSFLWMPWYGAGSPSWRRALLAVSLLWGTVIVGIGLTLVSSHGDGRGISVVLSGLAASTAWLTRRAGDSAVGEPSLLARSLRGDLARVTVVLTALLFIFPHAQSYMFLRHVSTKVGPPQFPRGPIRSLYMGSWANDLGPDCVPKMNEAISLLSAHCKPSDSVQYVGFTNIYNFALGLRSPRDSVIYWDTVSTYNQSHHPSPEDLWDTDFIMVPKDGLTISNMSREWFPIYGYHVRTHFALCEETTFYQLYKRKQDQSQ